MGIEFLQLWNVENLETNLSDPEMAKYLYSKFKTENEDANT